MEKLIRCAFCGRMNSSSNSVCSNCGTRLDAEISKTNARAYTKIPRKSDFDKLIESVRMKQQPPKNIYELLKPNDTKIFLFINMFFASLFLILFVKQKILFTATFYPVLYAFSCYWSTRREFDWTTFLAEFFVILAIFFLLFVGI